MRIALLSDIHGNTVALDAVLADASALGVDHFWINGDFCAIGPEPVAVLERVAALPNTRFTRGNTDRYVVTGDGPPPDLQMVRARPELIPTYAGIAASFAWTRGFITAHGWFDWLAELPLDSRHVLPNGMRLLVVHAAPGNDDGEGVHPGHSDAQLRKLLAGADADVVVVGHTHEPMIRPIDDLLLVNLGSVSNPRAPDLRASYLLLEASDTGIQLEHRRVAYDQQAFLQSVRRSRHPAAEFILGYQRGEQPGRPAHADHQPLIEGYKTRWPSIA